MMNGYPGDWAQITAAQKREYRPNRFLNPTNVKFVSPEAEKAYKIRVDGTMHAFPE
jgi:hypothetical protein